MKLPAERGACAAVALVVIFIVVHHVSASKHDTSGLGKEHGKEKVRNRNHWKRAPRHRDHGFFADSIPKLKLSEDMFGFEYGEYNEHSKQTVAKSECQKDDSTKEKVSQLTEEISLTRKNLIRCKANLSQYKIGEAKLIADVVKRIAKLLTNRTIGANSVVKAELAFTIEEKELFHHVSEFPFVPEREIHHAFDRLLKILEGANFTEYVHVPPEKVYYFESLVLMGVISICMMLTVGLLFQLRLGVSVQRVILLMFLFGIIVSVPWEWYRLYKEALALKLTQQETLKSKKCNPELLSTFESMTLWFKHTFMFGEDDCLKYHKSVLVDPTLEVSPIKAISSTITTSIITPLAMAFEGIGRSFNLLMKEIPLQWQVPVFLAILFMLVVVVFSVFGIDIRFLFAKMTVGGRLHRNDVVEGEAQRLEIQQLKVALDNANEQLAAVRRQNSQNLKRLPSNTGHMEGGGGRTFPEVPMVLHSGVEDVPIQEQEPPPVTSAEPELLQLCDHPPLQVADNSRKEPRESISNSWEEDYHRAVTLSTSNSYEDTFEFVASSEAEDAACNMNSSLVPESCYEDVQSSADNNSERIAQENSWTN